MIISFEGVDGSGKSFCSQAIKQWLEKTQPNSVHLIKEPDGKFRDLLLNTDLSPLAQLFVFMANRVEHVNNKMLHNTKDIFIFDRFIHSTVAYQHYGYGINKHFIEDLNDRVARFYKPDITFILMCPVETLLERIKNRSNNDSLDNRPIEFITKVQMGYIKMAKDNPNMIPIDASLPPDEVLDRIKKELMRYFND